MIEFDRASKAFGDRLALDAVSFDVRRGEVVALLGHNGAGKSTLFALALGLRRLTAGDVRIGGVSVRRHARRARRAVGSVLAPAFYEYLSGWDNLRLLASYSGAQRAIDLESAVRFVELEDRIHDRVAVYSHGMRRRLALAQALLPRPDVLLLDEWEAGLDPEGVAAMRALILRLNREHSMTILLSSHQPGGVDAMCDRVVILRHGRVVFAGRWDELDDGAPAVRLTVDDWPRVLPIVRGLGGEVYADRVVVPPAGGDVADLVAALVRAGVRVRAVEPVRRSAEDRYLLALQRSEPGVPADSRARRSAAC